MRIALDAGHGFKDGRPTGACANGMTEDATAWAIVHRLRMCLLKAGWEVVLTRPTQALVPLTSRGAIANARCCDAFVSVHINAAVNPKASGAEVLVAESDNRSMALAERLLDALVARGLRRRGVKWDSQSQHTRLKVLRDTYLRMPAVLLEIGFITNPADATKLRDQKWVEKTAEALCSALQRWQCER